MRIPFYIVIPSTILTILIVWWLSTRNIDFLTPPSAKRLKEIQQRTLASLPISRSEHGPEAIITPNPANFEHAENDPAVVFPGAVDIGELSNPKTLDTYSERAPDGAGKLLKLASELEKLDAKERAVLACERVVDLSQATPQQIHLALNRIRGIRPSLPTWNTQDDNTHEIVIHIGTGPKFAEVLPEMMENITQELGHSSSGLIKFSFELNIGQSIRNTDAPTPVALWLTGTGKKNQSTDVLSFTTNHPETLANELQKTLFNLIRGHLAKSTSYNPVPEIEDDPKIALSSNITRLLWHEFGKSLNPAPKQH